MAGPIRSAGRRNKLEQCCHNGNSDGSTQTRYSPYGVVESRPRSQWSEANYGMWFFLEFGVQVDNLRVLYHQDLNPAIHSPMNLASWAPRTRTISLPTITPARQEPLIHPPAPVMPRGHNGPLTTPGGQHYPLNLLLLSPPRHLCPTHTRSHIY